MAAPFFCNVCGEDAWVNAPNVCQSCHAQGGLTAHAPPPMRAPLATVAVAARSALGRASAPPPEPEAVWPGDEAGGGGDADEGETGRGAPEAPQARRVGESLDMIETPRLLCGFESFDEFVGGGLVVGTTVLISGAPGAGKTTLTMQLLAGLADTHDRNVLYVTGEQQGHALDMLAQRLGITGLSRLRLLSTSLMSVAATWIEELDPIAVVYDSLQVMRASAASEAASGTLAQVSAVAKEAVEVARQGRVVVVIGQINKDDKVAGPKTVEHLVDVVLHLDHQPGSELRRLKSPKNREGDNSGMIPLVMTAEGLAPLEPGAFLEERTEAAGSVAVAACEGQQVVFVLAEALVALAAPVVSENGTSREPALKASANGFPANRLGMLCGVLDARTDVDLSGKVMVSLAGGLESADTGAELGIVMAVVSAREGFVIPVDTVVFGEVGLSGSVRAVPRAGQRLREAARLNFTRALVPRSRRVQVPEGVDIELIPVGSLVEAISWLRGQERETYVPMTRNRPPPRPLAAPPELSGPPELSAPSDDEPGDEPRSPEEEAERTRAAGADEEEEQEEEEPGEDD